MRRFARIFLSLLGAFLLGYAAFLAVDIFGPLLFPEPITGSSSGENIVVFSTLIFPVIFGGGFLICWKLTGRFADNAKSAQGI